MSSGLYLVPRSQCLLERNDPLRDQKDRGSESKEGSVSVRSSQERKVTSIRLNFGSIRLLSLRDGRTLAL